MKLKVHRTYVSTQHYLFSRKGMSLIEVLISLSLLSIVSLGIISLLQNHNKSIQSVEEKLVILDLQKTLISLSAGKNICEKKFLETPALYTYPTASFPPAAGIGIDGLFFLPTDSIGIVEKNKPAQGLSTVIIDSIEFQNISGSGGNYIADLIIKFKGTVLIRKPINVKVNLLGKVVGADLILMGCMTANLVSNIDPNNIDSETACKEIGGEWVVPTEPNGIKFCSYPNSTLEWY